MTEFWALEERAARLLQLEEIAEGLRNLDWCIGYELTEAQHVELDDLRTKAFELLSKTNECSTDNRIPRH